MNTNGTNTTTTTITNHRHHHHQGNKEAQATLTCNSGNLKDALNFYNISTGTKSSAIHLVCPRHRHFPVWTINGAASGHVSTQQHPPYRTTITNCHIVATNDPETS
ncbi:hypothetical protein PoB_006193000 [Plakobranchus ocellatus]|uniref:Uncharacterized protein n=1 Tax=Plakobranchus ocellatus TaxID=259542 RepID=A0AAV4CU97_9GAST|nr:hypothetical protein PoB_006193000 [Plakobranchus ocellatus]